MRIRTYQTGDESAQVEIYNEAAAGLPRFKPAKVEEVARRCSAPGFDPSTRLYAEEDGRVVGYSVYHGNGRVSYPWCRRGCEPSARRLFERAVAALRERGVRRAFAAYRGDWPQQQSFFLDNGFTRVRDMVNFVADAKELPAAPKASAAEQSPLRRTDVADVFALAPGSLQARDARDLEDHLFANAHFPAESVQVLRDGRDGRVRAVGLLVLNPAYADPQSVDADMPCFRLGAFGTEGMQVKRINGLFSFLARADDEETPLALLQHAVRRLHAAGADALSAQAPSDAAHLLRFYDRHFRRHGSFPVLERNL